MRTHPRRWTIALLSALASTMTPALATDEATTATLPWTELVFVARGGLFLTGDVEMHLRRDGEGLRLETTTAARVLGATVARSETRSLLRPDGRPTEYVSRSPKNGRHYRFSDEGYVVRKLRPEGEPDSDLAEWETTDVLRYDNPGAGDRRAPVFDYYGLFLQLGQLGLEAPGDRGELYVATSSGPRRYTVVVAEQRDATLTYRHLGANQTRRRELREFRLRVIPESDDDKARGILGMRGETELWVDAGTKIPLRIVGKVPRVPGKLTIELIAMQ